jgi:hypothetical protein
MIVAHSRRMGVGKGELKAQSVQMKMFRVYLPDLLDFRLCQLDCRSFPHSLAHSASRCVKDIHVKSLELVIKECPCVC